MRICLLRHGETDWNNLEKLQGREDVPLNAKGIEQAKEAAQYLKKNNWRVIITSPLLRAKVSAGIISEAIGNIEIREEAAFVERDYGRASGMTPAERKAAFNNDEESVMEPFEILQDRTVQALFKYIQEYDGSDIIIVSHGLALNAILAYLTKNKIGGEKIKRINFKNASMTLLEKTDDKIEVIYFNKTAGELSEKIF
ncbi:MAG TPA: histidine phosphatase family protein [Treponema sp.]|nr:histidine phosphatase family protein [Treponema sp.]